jgi:hypothetical protein
VRVRRGNKDKRGIVGRGTVIWGDEYRKVGGEVKGGGKRGKEGLID